MTKSNSRKRQQNLLNYFKASRQEEHIEPAQHVPEASTSTSIQTNHNQQKPEAVKKGKMPIIILKKKKAPVIFDSDEEETNQDDDLAEEVIPRKRNKKRRLIVQSSDEEDDTEAPITIESEGAASDEDMDDDLDFLDKSDILTSRTRGKRPDSYAEKLKKLKDRKSKSAQYDNVEDGPIDSFVSSKRRTVVISSSSENDEDEDEGGSGESGSSDEDDFVVDDDIVDGQKVKSPLVNASLPAEFSTAKSMSFRRQMDFYIQSLIELVLDPAFDISSDQKYALANETINKRVQAYRDSMATSDVWLPGFKVWFTTQYPVPLRG
ncbi:unnamed protein product [Mucor fragilis]